jgi:hypothetical protein
MIDQDRPLVSAWASSQDPATPRFELKHAEIVAGALRELGEVTLQLAEVRDPDPSPPSAGGGFERAVAGLRAVGALTGPGGQAAPFKEGALGPALIAAALDCAADVPSERRRFLVPDRRQSTLVASELQALVRLTLTGPAGGHRTAEAVRSEIVRRQEDLGRGGSRLDLR